MRTKINHQVDNKVAVRWAKINDAENVCMQATNSVTHYQESQKETLYIAYELKSAPQIVSHSRDNCPQRLRRRGYPVTQQWGELSVVCTFRRRLKCPTRCVAPISIATLRRTAMFVSQQWFFMLGKWDECWRFYQRSFWATPTGR